MAKRDDLNDYYFMRGQVDALAFAMKRPALTDIPDMSIGAMRKHFYYVMGAWRWYCLINNMKTLGELITMWFRGANGKEMKMREASSEDIHVLLEKQK